MHIKKGTSRKDLSKIKQDAPLFTTKKEQMRKNKGNLEVKKSGVEMRPRINALSKAGRKKRVK